jgi:hypothetical protein
MDSGDLLGKNHHCTGAQHRYNQPTTVETQLLIGQCAPKQSALPSDNVMLSIVLFIGRSSSRLFTVNFNSCDRVFSEYTVGNVNDSLLRR